MIFEGVTPYEVAVGTIAPDHPTDAGPTSVAACGDSISARRQTTCHALLQSPPMRGGCVLFLPNSRHQHFQPAVGRTRANRDLGLLLRAPGSGNSIRPPLHCHSWQSASRSASPLLDVRPRR